MSGEVTAISITDVSPGISGNHGKKTGLSTDSGIPK
jgi:hypothetical protein